MLRYEEKIARFAQDKKFLRLPRPVRGRADALCDACGSTQPRTLYGLTDVTTKRHYFVGDSCLKELVKRGHILRRFGKQSGKQAYETEMQLRAGSPSGAPDYSEHQDIGSGDSPSETGPTEPVGPRPTDSGAISSQVLMVETREHYQCFVALIRNRDDHPACGAAWVAKYEEGWRASGASGLVLENWKRERPDAAVLCLARAWQEAFSHLVVLERMKDYPPAISSMSCPHRVQCSGSGLAQLWRRTMDCKACQPTSDGGDPAEKESQIQRLRELVRRSSHRNPHLTTKLEKAAFLVLLRPVENVGDDHYRIGSEDGLRVYDVIMGHCQ